MAWTWFTWRLSSSAGARTKVREMMTDMNWIIQEFPIFFSCFYIWMRRKLIIDHSYHTQIKISELKPALILLLVAFKGCPHDVEQVAYLCCLISLRDTGHSAVYVSTGQCGQSQASSCSLHCSLWLSRHGEQARNCCHSLCHIELVLISSQPQDASVVFLTAPCLFFHVPSLLLSRFVLWSVLLFCLCSFCLAHFICSVFSMLLMKLEVHTTSCRSFRRFPQTQQTVKRNQKVSGRNEKQILGDGRSHLVVSGLWAALSQVLRSCQLCKMAIQR